jgi:hypothetical protein
MILLDIVAIAPLMLAAVGVTSDLGMFLFFAVAGACLLVSGRPGAFDFVSKPVALNDLRDLVDRAFSLSAKCETSPQILTGESDAALALRATIKRSHGAGHQSTIEPHAGWVTSQVDKIQSRPEYVWQRSG